jgi:hypothetical protein
MNNKSTALIFACLFLANAECAGKEEAASPEISIPVDFSLQR